MHPTRCRPPPARSHPPAHLARNQHRLPGRGQPLTPAQRVVAPHAHRAVGCARHEQRAVRLVQLVEGGHRDGGLLQALASGDVVGRVACRGG